MCDACQPLVSSREDVILDAGANARNLSEKREPPLLARRGHTSCSADVHDRDTRVSRTRSLLFSLDRL